MSEQIKPAADYDQFVDWAKRLGREAPFFRRVFDGVGAASVIDVGAGSAKHSVMFAEWGLSVDAVDPDESMLAQAGVNAAEAADRIADAGGELRLVRGGFGDLARLGLGPADVLVCTGNALPHVADADQLRAAIADFAAAIRPGGAIVLHLLNHARLLDRRPRVVPPVVRETPEGTKVYLRVIDYVGNEFLDFDFVTLVRDAAGEWSVSDRRSKHMALPAELLTTVLVEAGFDRVEVFGGHDGHELTDEDESVIIFAHRAP